MPSDKFSAPVSMAARPISGYRGVMCHVRQSWILQSARLRYRPLPKVRALPQYAHIRICQPSNIAMMMHSIRKLRGAGKDAIALLASKPADMAMATQIKMATTPK